MTKNVIIMIGDGMGWEMARAAAIAKRIAAGEQGNTLRDFYTEGKGSGLSFQNLANYGIVTTYGTTVAGSDGRFSTGNSALDDSKSGTGESYVRPRFGFNPNFNPGNSATGGASVAQGAVGNLVGYDPARGGFLPWAPGNDPEYIKYSFPDSANTATTIYTGVKTYNNGIGVDIYEKPLDTILATANRQGKSTGLVSSVPIDHATPGAAAANVNRRNKYDADFPDLDNILQQELRIYQPTVLIGGGHPLAAGTKAGPLPPGVEPPTSNEFITKSTYQELSNNPTDNRYGYTFVERGPNAAQTLANTAATINPDEGDRLLGLYGARGQNGNIPLSSANGDYSTTGLDNFSVFTTKGQNPDVVRPLLPGETDQIFIGREVNENPTLLDMTKAALDVLEDDQDGFWLMVEGGDIDWSMHDDNVDNLIGTMFDFDKSVQATIDWINKNGGFEENLLIVTADHDHYFTLKENFPQLLREKGAQALTDIDDPTQAGHFFGSKADIKYGWGDHTNRPVPIYYQGVGSERITNFISQGYNAYGYDIPGVKGMIDQSHIFQSMFAAVTFDTLVGGEGSDTIQGKDGNDIIFGKGGNDLLFGNQGVDTVDGGEGNDRVHGGKDEDFLTGGNGNDLVKGDFGNDSLFGNDGSDTLDGGEGNDTVYGGKGNDFVQGNKGNDFLSGDLGNDTVFGNLGNDSLFGGDGDDLLRGGKDNDLLEGGNGNDELWGDLGNDSLTGGAGVDRFVFTKDGSSDVILDFQDGQDLIALAGGLQFSQLTITQGNNATTVNIGTQLLATINGVAVANITTQDFVTIQ
ncbi:MAG: alkaline phosphatase [Phormidium sp.]